MIQPIILQSPTTNPYYNLSVEEYLQKNLKENEIALYLWQNADCVVIGRAQNPWRECNLDYMEEQGISLMRRTTGGGAVFHDSQNLNFSFIVPKGIYDYERQCRVILEAVKEFDLVGERNGRNDLTVGGRKFSGNAFSRLFRHALHHGTILIHTDVLKMKGSLQVSAQKMKAKGVKSVVSRVVNLQELVPDLTVEKMKAALCRAFEAEYGEAEYRTVSVLEKTEMEKLEEKNRSHQWLYGEYRQFDFTLSDRLGWGEIELCAKVEDGIIRDIEVYSDALDVEFILRLRKMLRESKANINAMADVVENYAWDERQRAMAAELADWLRSAEMLS